MLALQVFEPALESLLKHVLLEKFHIIFLFNIFEEICVCYLSK